MLTHMANISYKCENCVTNVKTCDVLCYSNLVSYKYVTHINRKVFQGFLLVFTLKSVMK